jgi:hypothetical protein
MTKIEGKAASAAVNEILLSNPDGLRDVIRAVMQEVLEAAMDETLGAVERGTYGRTRRPSSGQEADQMRASAARALLDSRRCLLLIKCRRMAARAASLSPRSIAARTWRCSPLMRSR